MDLFLIHKFVFSITHILYNKEMQYSFNMFSQIKTTKKSTCEVINKKGALNVSAFDASCFLAGQE